MVSSLWIAMVLLAPAAAHAPDDLVAAAAASGRPRECMPMDGGDRRSAIWLSASTPKLARYCSLLSRAHARVVSDASGARKLAEEAQALLPKLAAPQVVVARAALRAGQHAVALAAFDEALARDARAVEQPLALYDLAQAQRLSGKNAEALASYRVLVPRASLLPTRTLRAQVLLEAAHVAMLSGKPAERDEALAYLREAAHDPHHALRLDVALSLVLTLDRAGRRAQADAILAEQRGSARFVTRDAPSYLANFDDLALLRALSLEISDPAAAREHYQRYLASPSGQGAYADAARARSARLTTKRGR